jgi:hypothetical protein
VHGGQAARVAAIVKPAFRILRNSAFALCGQTGPSY